MTTEFKIGQQFFCKSIDTVIVITNITDKGKIFVSSGTSNLANKNIMRKWQIKDSEIKNYLNINHWTIINN